MDKIKICILLGWFAGGDRRVIEVIKHFDKSIFDVTLIFSRHLYHQLNVSPKLGSLKYYAISAPFPSGGRMLDLFKYAFYVLRTTMFVSTNESSYDIVYCPQHELEMVIPALVIKARGKSQSLLMWVHHLLPAMKIRRAYEGRSLVDSLLNLLRYVFEPISLIAIKKYCDVVLTPTRHVQKAVIQRGICPNVFCVGNGIDVEFIDSVRGNLLMLDACALGAHPKKGTLDLIAAWSIVTRKLKHAKLSIFGYSGGWESKVKHLISVLELADNAELVGFVSKNKKFEMLKSSKLFLCPSYEEGWSLSISEAMACRVPVVAYDNPVFREVYTNHIFYVPHGDIKELARAIVTFLTNRDGIATKYADRSVTWARMHDSKEIAKREQSILASLLKRA